MWNSNDQVLRDETEDLQETNGILKKLRESLATTNAAERQQNINLISDLVNRLVNRLQSRITSSTMAPDVSAGLDYSIFISDSINTHIHFFIHDLSFSFS